MSKSPTNSPKRRVECNFWDFEWWHTLRQWPLFWPKMEYLLCVREMLIFWANRWRRYHGHKDFFQENWSGYNICVVTFVVTPIVFEIMLVITIYSTIFFEKKRSSDQKIESISQNMYFSPNFVSICFIEHKIWVPKPSTD